MARRPRLVVPGQAMHVAQRGNNRVPTFLCDDDRAFFLRALLECSKVSGCAIHAYVLMNNHFHLLLTPETVDAPSRMMRLLGSRYVRYFNTLHVRTGTLWEGRFWSTVIDSERYLFSCLRYIELNPVRALMAASPSQYRWSSSRCNALGRADSLVTPHPLYLALGSTPADQREAYQALFDTALESDVLETIRRATRKGGLVSATIDRMALEARVRGARL